MKLSIMKYKAIFHLYQEFISSFSLSLPQTEPKEYGIIQQ